MPLAAPVSVSDFDMEVDHVYDASHLPLLLCSNGTLKDATPLEHMRSTVYCPGSQGYLRAISIFNVAEAYHRYNWGSSASVTAKDN